MVRFTNISPPLHPLKELSNHTLYEYQHGGVALIQSEKVCYLSIYLSIYLFFFFLFSFLLSILLVGFQTWFRCSGYFYPTLIPRITIPSASSSNWLQLKFLSPLFSGIPLKRIIPNLKKKLLYNILYSVPLPNF